MKIRSMVENALKAGQSALDQTEASQLLKAYGVPLVTEEITADPEAAAIASQAMTFPVVLKGIGPELHHKTEHGLVRLHLDSPGEVRQAAEAMMDQGETSIRQLQLQSQIEGKREFMAGLVRDPVFGPMVMFGLGGIFAEVLADTTFGTAPLPPGQAREMLGHIRAQKMLGAFRGSHAVNQNQLIQVIEALARIAVEIPEISEIDLNPLLADNNGEIWAVDALITLAKPQAETTLGTAQPITPPQRIGQLFYPRAIAFIGASGTLGKWGHMLLTNTLNGGYEGRIALVNPKGGTIMGRAVYPSVAEIPFEVDLAMVTIPAQGVPDLIPQLRDKGIRNMVLITSGFGETDKEGKERERELVAAARRAGILILGPNTMGIANPHIKLNCIGSPVYPRAGSTAVVAQSGNMGIQLLAFAEAQGIGIRAFIGSGNEAMLTIEDYLEAFGADEKTRTVMMYVESVKNGPRFLEAAHRVGQAKPIVMLKGGRSAAGNRAAASHTGALASDQRVFTAACDQAGIVRVDYSMDMLDLAAAFSALPLPRGNRVAIMTLGGGWGVVASDLCAHQGLELPALPPDLLARLDRILPPYWSRTNPVDIVGEKDWSIPMTIMEALLEWEECDVVLNLGIMGRKVFGKRLIEAAAAFDPQLTGDHVAAVVAKLGTHEERYVNHIVELMERYRKPVYGVTLLAEGQDQTVFRVPDKTYAGIFYPTPERAAKAIAKMYAYGQFRQQFKSSEI